MNLSCEISQLVSWFWSFRLAKVALMQRRSEFWSLSGEITACEAYKLKNCNYGWLGVMKKVSIECKTRKTFKMIFPFELTDFSFLIALFCVIKIAMTSCKSFPVTSNQIPSNDVLKTQIISSREHQTKLSVAHDWKTFFSLNCF